MRTDEQRAAHAAYMREYRQRPGKQERHRELSRESRNRNLEKVREKDRERGYRVYDPAKVAARKAASRIERQVCERDGCEELGHRHHDDYSKPLDIRFLCPAHHGEEHRKCL